MRHFEASHTNFWRSIGTVSACVGSAIITGVLLTAGSATRLAIAVVLVAVAASFTVRAPNVVLYLLAVWLVVLGTIRRMTTGLMAAGNNLDPLLAVEPLVLVILGILAVSMGALRRRTSLTNAALALICILTLSALNPLQGSVRVGFTGAAVVVTPMLAFLIGRTMISDRVLRRTLILTAVLAVPAAAYGLYQIFGHFPSWDQRWINRQKAFLALNVGGSIRPFGSFASGQEFGLYTAIGLVILLAFVRRSRWLWISPLLVLLSFAVWYESSRTIVVVLAFTGVLAGATRIGWPLRRSILLALVALVALPSAAAHVLPKSFADSASGRLQGHQVAGLIDPLGQQSTLPFHATLVVNGLLQAVSNPLGRGVGSVTGAAQKFGVSSAGTEYDPGNVAVAAGVLGLVAYLSVTVLALRRASQHALQRWDTLSIAALSILAVTLLQWLNGGLYSVGWLPWLVLGWVDHPRPANDFETIGTPALPRLRTAAGP